MGRTSRVLALVRKDLLRRRRSPLGVLALIAFPLIFSGMMALVFGGSGAGIPRARLLLEDRDGSVAGGAVKAFLGADELRDFLEVVEVGPEGRQRIDDGEASALLVLPADMTADLVAGRAVTLELVRNPAQGILPEIAEQVTAILADVLSIVTRLLRAQVESLGLESSIEDLSIEDLSLEDLGDLTDEDFGRLAVSLRRTLEAAGSFLETPPLTFETAILGAEEDEDGEEGGSRPVNVFLFILPGISVYALFLIGDQMMRDVLVESRLGTLARQLSAPVRAGEIVAGKVLVAALVAAAVLVVLAAIAGLVAPRPVDLPAFALLSFALVLAITGFAATIYSLVRTEGQGGTLSALLYLTLAFSGGSFFPFEDMPEAVRATAPVNPFYWGTRGFQRLLDQGGLADVAGSIAVLGGIGAVLLVLGTVLLQRKVLRGDAK
jgi:ABC-type multidrug transport system permease subunit